MGKSKEEKELAKLEERLKKLQEKEASLVEREAQEKASSFSEPKTVVFRDGNSNKLTIKFDTSTFEATLSDNGKSIKINSITHQIRDSDDRVIGTQTDNLSRDNYQLSFNEPLDIASTKHSGGKPVGVRISQLDKNSSNAQLAALVSVAEKAELGYAKNNSPLEDVVQNKIEGKYPGKNGEELYKKHAVETHAIEHNPHQTEIDSLVEKGRTAKDKILASIKTDKKGFENAVDTLRDVLNDISKEDPSIAAEVKSLREALKDDKKSRSLEHVKEDLAKIAERIFEKDNYGTSAANAGKKSFDQSQSL